MTLEGYSISHFSFYSIMAPLQQVYESGDELLLEVTPTEELAGNSTLIKFTLSDG